MTNADRIAENLAGVRRRIAAAAWNSGRAPDDVKLVAVTKYVDAAITRLLVEAGCRDLGESRPQQLWEKAAALADAEVHWHLVGHLQRNKIRRTLPLVQTIHSIDSESLLRAVERIAAELQRTIEVLLEVNISGDESKHGLAPDAVAPLLDAAAELAHVRIAGLMTMASLSGGPDVARGNFAALRKLRDRLRPNCPANVSLRELSMGMSGDFEQAIAEGATIVRVGSALFSGIEK